MHYCKKSLIALLLFTILFSAKGVFAQNSSKAFNYIVVPRIVKVIDGDTVRIWMKESNVNVRLAGIDCYETSVNSHIQHQRNRGDTDESIIERGLRAKSILINKLRAHHPIYLEITGVDERYGRLVGIFYYKDNQGKLVSINREMMMTGYCPQYNFRKKRY